MPHAASAVAAHALSDQDVALMIMTRGDQPLNAILLDGIDHVSEDWPTDQTVAAVSARLLAVCDGSDRRGTVEGALRAALYSNPAATVPLHGLALIETHGLDPARTVATLLATGGITIRPAPGISATLWIRRFRNPGRRHAGTTRTWDRGSLDVDLSPGIRMDGADRIVVPAIAQTLAIDLPGRSLATVLSHPVLDRFPMTISTVTTSASGRTSNILLEGVQDVRGDRLAAWIDDPETPGTGLP